jgi:hypothetical protein
MPRTFRAAVAVVATLVVGAFATASASATTAGWMLNGTLLSAEGLSSAALAPETINDERFEFNGGGGLQLECSSLLGDGGEIKSPNTLRGAQVLFKGCKTTTANCTVAESIATTALTVEVTLDGALAVKGDVKPQTGTVLATTKYSGEACAIAGTKLASGDVEILAAELQDERTDQRISAVQSANGLFKFASNAASATGTDLVLLGNQRPWSFL